VIQLYVNEAGNLIATEEFEPNREPWSFASVSPSIPELYRCLACGHVFQEHPGPAVECPRCGHMYASAEGGLVK
jgi:rubredoxin